MHLFLVLIQTMTSLVYFEDVVQTSCSNITALCNHISKFSLASFFFKATSLFVPVYLCYESFDCTCVKYVDYAAMQNFMNDQRVMPTIMEYFEYFPIHKNSPENILSHLNCLVVLFDSHSLEVDEEGVVVVPKLNHLDGTSLPENPLHVYSQYLTAEYVMEMGCDGVAVDQINHFFFLQLLLLDSQFLVFWKVD